MEEELQATDMHEKDVQSSGRTEPGKAKKRNLDDLSKTASMDMVAINNLIVSLRAPVKKARVKVIHQLTRKTKQLRNKKGKDDEVKKNQEKAERLGQEIKTLNGLDVDKVAKFALSNTVGFDELMLKQPDVSMITRAMTRLSSSSDLDQRVQRFRVEHDDWKELVNFILYKNTGRRYRKNKSKRKEGETVIRDMVVKKLEAESRKSEAKNESEAVSDDGAASESEASSENEVSGSDSYDQVQDKQSATKIRTESREKLPQNDEESSELSEDSDSPMSTSPAPPVDAGTALPNVVDKLARRLLGLEESSRSSSTTVSSDHKNDKSDDSDSTSEDEKKTDSRVRDVVNGDMVVTRLNLNEPLIQVQDSDRSAARVKHKPKSSFFLKENGSDDDDNEKADEPEDGEPDQAQSSRDLSEEQTARGRRMVESIFISNLSRREDREGGEGREGRGGYNSGRESRGRSSGRGDYSNSSGRGGRGRSSGRGDGYSHSTGRGRQYERQQQYMLKQEERGFSQRGRGGRSGNNRNQQTQAFGFGNSELPKETKVEETLHPSWEASRKRKEASSIQAFAGKKIKFDDDDDDD